MWQVVVSMLTSDGVAVAVQASSLLCVAELVSSLKAHAIPHLNSFLPALITILNNTNLLAK